MQWADLDRSDRKHIETDLGIEESCGEIAGAYS